MPFDPNALPPNPSATQPPAMYRPGPPQQSTNMSDVIGPMIGAILMHYFQSLSAPQQPTPTQGGTNGQR